MASTTDLTRLAVGARVVCNATVGTILFLGTTAFASGRWVGVALDEPNGKNDGSVLGQRYFECAPACGLFVRPGQVKFLESADGVDQSSRSNQHSPTSSSEHSYMPDHSTTYNHSTASNHNTTPYNHSTAPGHTLEHTHEHQHKSLSVLDTAQKRSSTSLSRLKPPTATTTTRHSSSRQQSPVDRTSSLSRSATSRDSSMAREVSSSNTHSYTTPQKLTISPNELSESRKSMHTSRGRSPTHKSNSPTQRKSESILSTSLPSSTLLTPKRLSAATISAAAIGTNSSTPPLSSSIQDSTINSSFDLPQSIHQQSSTINSKELEELKFKLKSAELKLLEDRDKISKLELTQQSAQLAIHTHDKLNQRTQDLLNELQLVKKQLNDSLIAKESIELKYQEVMDDLELITLDKEVAEARVDQINSELESIREKFEEMTLDLEVFKAEKELLQASQENNSYTQITFNENQPSSTSTLQQQTELIQLKLRNQRLQDALVKLRDLSAVDETTIQRQSKLIERDTTHLQELKSSHDDLKRQLYSANETISELRLQLNEAEAQVTEEVLSELTIRNLQMGERIEELERTVNDLEAMRDMNEEFIELHTETERDLQKEIDQKLTIIRHMRHTEDKLTESIADYENTVGQFRELVRTLQSDIDRFKQTDKRQSQNSLGSITTTEQVLASQSQAMQSLNMRLQTSAHKAKAKAIELELRILDTQQARDEVKYIQPYLSEAFFVNEQDSIKCLLLMDRLHFKSTLVLNNLTNTGIISEQDTHDITIAKQYRNHTQFKTKMHWFSGLSKRLILFMESCDVPSFMKLGRVYRDILVTEKRLDVFIEALKNETLKSSVVLNDIQYATAQLEHLVELMQLHEQQSPPVRYQHALMSVEAIEMHINVIEGELILINAITHLPSDTEDAKMLLAFHTFTDSFVTPMRIHIKAQSSTIKQSIRKITRLFKDLEQTNTALQPSLNQLVQDHLTTARQLTKFYTEVSEQIYKQAASSLEHSTPKSLADFESIVFNGTLMIFDKRETVSWQVSNDLVKRLSQDLHNLWETCSTSEVSEKYELTEHPYMLRSQELKNKQTVNEEMDRKLATLNDRIITLLRDVKGKEQMLQESQVKVELLERRADNTRREQQVYTHLEDDVAALKTREEECHVEIERLNKEIDRLESENKRFNSGKHAIDIVSAGRQGGMLNGNNDEMETIEQYRIQIDSLRIALRHVRSENAHMKSKVLLSKLNINDITVPPLRFITRLEDNNRLTNTSNKATAVNKTRNEKLKELAMETTSLTKDIKLFMASPRIVDLTESGKSTYGQNRPWQSMILQPEYQHETQKTRMANLHAKAVQVQHKLSMLSSQQSTHTSLSTTRDRNTSTTLIRSNVVAKESSGRNTRIGTVHIPAMTAQSNHGRLTCTLRSITELEHVHTIFVS